MQEFDPLVPVLISVDGSPQDRAWLFVKVMLTEGMGALIAKGAESHKHMAVFSSVCLKHFEEIVETYSQPMC
jgi:hypothetical protein